MMDLIKTSLGTLTATGNGDARQALPGQHLANIIVSGTGAVSAAGSIQGTNDLSAPWKDIGAFSISGTDSAAGTVSWALDYLYWRFVATGLTGSKVSAIVASESLEKAGGLSTVLGDDGIARLDDASRAVLRNSSIGFLTSSLISAFESAKGTSPLDLAVMASPPTVTVGAAAITNGQAYNYFDTEGHKRIRIKGVPFGDTSVMSENVGGYFRGVNVGNSGGSFVNSGNAKHYLCEVLFTGQIIQFVLNGLSAGLIRFRVNGALVSASATTVGNGNVQLDFGATVYNKTISLEFEQSQTVKGVVVGPNDTIYAVDTPPVPLVVVGDSYIQGVTSPVTFGAETYCGCLRDASGLNVLALGIPSAGYIKPGVVTLTNAQWLARIIAATNAASAPLILIPYGTNDYGLDATAIQAAAASVGASLLAGTSAKIAFMGPWPQNRNNDAGSLAVEAAIQSAALSLDRSRVGFIPVCSGNSPWVKGQGDNDTAPNGTSIAYGNSAIVTGNDGVHPYPGRGSEYLARKTIDALIALCASKGW